MSADNAHFLPFLRDRGSHIARQGKRLITTATFLSDVAQLADQLPDRPHVVNFCSDRYRFTVAWAACMLRHQVTLLPGSRDAGAVTALYPDYPALYVVSDDEQDVPGPWFAYPALPPGATTDLILGFPPDRIAAVLFTSGSSGRPHPSPRRWGRLVAASRAAGAALGVAHFSGSAVVATVPHAHSYGLESAVMLPLQHGLLLTAERPFFPADIAAALDRDDPPGLLVTTPIHLRTLVGDAKGFGVGTSFKAGFVLSATAPLSHELAAQTETVFNAPVFEIYGCSEAGQLATRRTIDGPLWRCLDGFRLYNDPDGCWAAGPEEPDIRIADEIEPAGADKFTLWGRTADQVNVAGKRSSLAYLTGQLTAIDGVEDGVFLLPEDNAPGATPRLAAVAVAPGLDAATILGQLRGRIDAAFLPRPLHVVDALPRNDLGKLPRAELLRLVERGNGRETPTAGLVATEASTAPAIRHKPFAVAPGTSSVPGTVQAGRPAPSVALADAADGAFQPIVLLHFPADHPTSHGHFPGNPIIPGAVLLDTLMATLFPDGWTGEIEFTKFHHKAQPGDTLSIRHTTEGGSVRFEGRLAGTAQLVVSGAVRITRLSQ
jgi:hypothetical protein